MIKTNKLLTKGKSLLLAYDQGLEHGPADFNIQNIDPFYILDIAIKGQYNGMILQAGVAEKYFEHYSKKVQLIVKLNGRTNIANVDPYSPQVCTVRRAIKMNADAVGFTVYVGSPREAEIFSEFSKIVEEAHEYGIPVIAWMYPRGKFVANDTTTEILAYAARIGLELGADFVKMKYNNDIEGFKWAVKAAGKTKVLVAGGDKMPENEFLKKVEDIMKTGATGLALGRNIWQSEKPLELTKKVKKIVFG